MKHYYLVFLLIGLCGCETTSKQSTVEQMSATQVGKSVTVSRDEFKKTVSITTPEILYLNQGYETQYKYQLSATLEAGDSHAFYTLALKTRRSAQASWALWDHALDINGVRFTLENAVREVGYGGIAVEVALTPISRAYLEGIRYSGIRWKAYGERGTSEFEVFGNVVSALLDAVDAQQNPAAR